VSLWCEMAKSPLNLACRPDSDAPQQVRESKAVIRLRPMSHGTTVAHRVAASLGPAGPWSSHSEAVAVKFWRRLRTRLRCRSDLWHTTTVPPCVCCCGWLPMLPFLPLLLLLLPIKVPIIFDTENLRDL